VQVETVFRIHAGMDDTETANRYNRPL